MIKSSGIVYTVAPCYSVPQYAGNESDNSNPLLSRRFLDIRDIKVRLYALHPAGSQDEIIGTRLRAAIPSGEAPGLSYANISHYSVGHWLGVPGHQLYGFGRYSVPARTENEPAISDTVIFGHSGYQVGLVPHSWEMRKQTRMAAGFFSYGERAQGTIGL